MMLPTVSNMSSLRDFKDIGINSYKYLVPTGLYKIITLQDFAENSGELNEYGLIL